MNSVPPWSFYFAEDPLADDEKGSNPHLLGLIRACMDFFSKNIQKIEIVRFAPASNLSILPLNRKTIQHGNDMERQIHLDYNDLCDSGLWRRRRVGGEY